MSLNNEIERVTPKQWQIRFRCFQHISDSFYFSFFNYYYRLFGILFAQTSYMSKLERIKKWKVSYFIFSRLAAEIRLVLSNWIPNFRNRTNESKRIEKKNMTKRAPNEKWQLFRCGFFLFVAFSFILFIRIFFRAYKGDRKSEEPLKWGNTHPFAAADDKRNDFFFPPKRWQWHSV